jgi:hypothetical protein
VLYFTWYRTLPSRQQGEDEAERSGGGE